MSTQRWFTETELADLSRPTMDRAIEAIDAGDLATARALCVEMRREWRGLHDVMVELIAGLITFVKDRLGDDGVEAAWRETMVKAWRDDVGKALQLDRRRMVQALAATWRAHSGSGTGQNPGAFLIAEDDEKFTFTMNPCGSGQRLWRNGGYTGPNSFGTTDGAHDWTYGRTEFPLYCSHCSFMNEILPIEWYGMPLYPSQPPGDFDHDPCVWHWYKDPDDVPDEHWARYGLTRGATS